MLLTIWAVNATVIALGLAILHFTNPYPLIQVPDRGHRLYAVPEEQHDVIVGLLRRIGLKPFGTFTAGVRQTLFRDGFTVIASGEGLQKAAISFPCAYPVSAANEAKWYLGKFNIEATIWEPPEAVLKEKLCVLKLPECFGWDIAFRVQGRDMPWPKWE